LNCQLVKLKPCHGVFRVFVVPQKASKVFSYSNKESVFQNAFKLGQFMYLLSFCRLCPPFISVWVFYHRLFFR